jgi:hypothetical protein
MTNSEKRAKGKKADRFYKKSSVFHALTKLVHNAALLEQLVKVLHVQHPTELCDRVPLRRLWETLGINGIDSAHIKALRNLLKDP